MPTKNTFGTLISTHRKLINVSQESLAKSVKMKREKLSLVENDRQDIKLSKALKIAHTLVKAGAPKIDFYSIASNSLPPKL